MACCVWLCSCNPQDIREPDYPHDGKDTLALTPEELQNKVLGMIVGSAIGDAMGAPTEMWSREEIDKTYGWVIGLDSMVREVSPEGIWIPNLPAGGTTDDTRWKKLAFEYLTAEKSLQLDPKQFAKRILTEYESAIAYFQRIKGTDPDPFYANMLRVGWLQEWAKVAKPFLVDDLSSYMDGLSTFYGGEMVCAGLLYTPAIGVFFPGRPEEAYKQAYALSIFDLGYARDISALAAAMTSAAMELNPSQANVLAVLSQIDPEGYFQTRLVGRSSYRILQKAMDIVAAVQNDSLSKEAASTPDRMRKAFALLDENLQDMPFHAGEIHLQVLTALLFADFDFELTLQFLVNYGRDNDTTAAVAGAILGAFYGFQGLPANLRTQVLLVNKDVLTIDLIDLSAKLTDQIVSLHQN
jgi:ADP-ribosylglycohydrolase